MIVNICVLHNIRNSISIILILIINHIIFFIYIVFLILSLSLRLNDRNIFFIIIFHIVNLFLIVNLNFSKIFFIIKSVLNNNRIWIIITITLTIIKIMKFRINIIKSIIYFIRVRLSNNYKQIKKLIIKVRISIIQSNLKNYFNRFRHRNRNKNSDWLIMFMKIRDFNWIFNTIINND